MKELFGNIRKGCKYRIIGIGHISGSNTLEVDLVCGKCGRSRTVIVNRNCEAEILKRAAAGKYFKVKRSDIIRIIEN